MGALKKRESNIFIILLIFVSVLFSGCKKDEKALFENLRDMENEYYADGDVKQKEQELKEGIREYKDILEMKVDAGRQLGIYYKSLGKLYFDNSMYKMSIDAFSEAIDIYPENPVLLYYRGLCYSRYSKAVMNKNEEIQLLNLAEKNYVRAIELDNNFAKAMYALSILYVFELDFPEKAVDTLERLLEIQKSNFDAMFLLANSYIKLGLIDMADKVYQNIIRNSRNSDYKRQAEENRKAILDGSYGW